MQLCPTALLVQKSFLYVIFPQVASLLSARDKHLRLGKNPLAFAERESVLISSLRFFPVLLNMFEVLLSSSCQEFFEHM